MSEVYKDNRGTPLQIGCHVAYNLSGQIAKGKITDIKTVFRYGKPRPEIKVSLLHRAAGHPPGITSTITSPKNLLILFGTEAWREE